MATTNKNNRHVGNVAELFAGVGGFRIGLEKAGWNVVYSNQWEPSTKTQHASDVYVDRFGESGHVNKDISTIEPSDIPEHDLLVGGFPCQDYSVASSLKNSKGIEGKKGVLWWEIHRLLEGMTKRPKHILLENVDRLLSSPSKQKGRDFAIILSSLSNLGYSIEWMVIDPSLYGMSQKRKRVFILGHLSDIGTVLDKAFPSEKELYNEFTVESDILSVSNNFNKGGKKSPFSHYGTVTDHHVRTYKITSTPTNDQVTLDSVL
jgi:DNA (cytosine-5)-methyltransferase 1